MVRIRTLLSSVMAFSLMSASVYAEGNDSARTSVSVRGSDKGDYSRIVFDWGTIPKYKTAQSEKGVVITFDTEANFLNGGTAPESLSRITGYKIISPTSVEIDFSKDKSLRHFIADNRLIVDIKDGQSTPKAEEKPAEENKEKGTAPVEEEKPVELAAAIEKVVESAAGDERNVEPKVEPIKSEAEVAPEEISPKIATPKNQIVITSTETIALAAFKRSGYLWIVEDKENIKLPPRIDGEGADKLGVFERVPSVPGASIFRIKLPGDATPVASGGGLVWKIDLVSSADQQVKPVELQRLSGEKAKDTSPSLLWPASDVKRVIEIPNPENGEIIQVAVVETAKNFSGQARHYIDFDTLPSFVGLALVSKADELKFTKAENGAVIEKPEGLILSPEKDLLTTAAKADPAPVKVEGDKEITRIYDFKDWQVGTEDKLSDNQRLIMSTMAAQTESKRAESLIGLSRLVLSFNYAPEALGYLDLAKAIVPDLDSNPEFIALRAAAEALSWKYKEAFADFSGAGLHDIDEIAYWKAFTLAKLDDWQQAAKILPNDVSILETYPEEIKNPLAMTLAEVALREGNKDKAKNILDTVASGRAHMDLPYASAYDYLYGEYERQNNKPDEAKKLWKELSSGKDDLYRAKARFAQTMLQLNAKEIEPDKAIDDLEGLRYAWRGDDLEVSINYNLAKTYLDKGEPIKALTMLKLAHSLNPLSGQGKKIDADMHDIFKSLFVAEKIKTLNPVDAMTVYSEFSDLIPKGEEGDVLTRQLAERMVDADLLPRAIGLLKKQVDAGLQGLEGATVATRLAALQNIDGKPDDALATLDKAEGFLKGFPAENVLPKQRDIGLLRAKALSMKGAVDDAFNALALLPQDEDTLRLRADIAWQGRKWQDAADSLEQLIQKQDISLTRPLTDEQADLILNWAVALYLADNRYVLANVRERYADAMASTPKADKFDVVTRPRQAAMLADRDTINAIVDETVIFKDFLKSFKANEAVTSSGVAPIMPIPTPRDIPQELQNSPSVKTDEVLGD
jgi:predicted negative regulator of RcsB-dependent stress response